jgi:hypothetical protein
LDADHHHREHVQKIQAAIDQLREQVAPLQQSSVAAVRAVNPSSHAQIIASRNGAYQHLIVRVRQVVHNTLPPKVTVIVISKGDDELLKLDGRRAWHFPQNEKGIYAGYYPPDSSAALAHLKVLRSKGGNYLLIPSTAFWWLDHYAEFGQYLKRHCRLVVRQEDACVIYSLREPPRKPKSAGKHKEKASKEKLKGRAKRV